MDRYTTKIIEQSTINHTHHWIILNLTKQQQTLKREHIMHLNLLELQLIMHLNQARAGMELQRVLSQRGQGEARWVIIDGGAA